MFPWVCLGVCVFLNQNNKCHQLAKSLCPSPFRTLFSCPGDFEGVGCVRAERLMKNPCFSVLRSLTSTCKREGRRLGLSRLERLKSAPRSRPVQNPARSTRRVRAAGLTPLGCGGEEPSLPGQDEPQPHLFWWFVLTLPSGGRSTSLSCPNNRVVYLGLPLTWTR